MSESLPDLHLQGQIIDGLFAPSVRMKIITALAETPNMTRTQILEEIGSPQISGGSSLTQLNHLVKLGVIDRSGEKPAKHRLSQTAQRLILEAASDKIDDLQTLMDNIQF